MYHPSTISASIAKLERAFSTTLVEHTPAECEEMEFRLRNAVDIKGNPTRALAADEQAFIQNELLFCKASFHYAVSRYFRIRNKDGLVQKLTPLLGSQEFVLQRLGEIEQDESRTDGLLVNVLKATRQVGMSVLAQALHSHRGVTQDNVTCLVASDTPDRSYILFGIAEMMVDELPWWLRPKVTDRVKNQELKFEGGSQILVHSGKSMKGAEGKRGQIGRGLTLLGTHLCVSGRTPIVLSDGRVVPMSEVAQGDEVFTHTGTTAQVLARMKSRRTSELTSEIWPWGACAPISTTRDHLVLTSEGWRQAQTIKPGDWVRYPVRPITHERTTFFIASTKVRSKKKPPTGHVFPLDRAWGYILGLYLAEGSLGWHKRSHNPHYTNSVVWSVDLDEVESVKSRVVEAYGRVTGVGANLHSRTRTVRLSHAGLARWIDREFGSKDTKRIPPWAWQAGREFCVGLVHGYLDGDGHWVPDANEIVATSVRVQLSQQFRDLIASLRCGWSAIGYKAPGVYYERNCRAAWMLQISGPTAVAVRALVGRPEQPVTEAKHWRWAGSAAVDCEVYLVGDGYSDDFYDIEVDSADHSFCSLFGALHNSEVSTFEDPDQLQGSLFPAIPRNRRSLAFFETTAQGRGTWFHKHWKDSRAGKTRFKSIYIPWYVQKEHTLRPTAGWEPTPTTVDHARRIEATSEAMTGRRHTPTRPQLFWYETVRGEYEAVDRLHDFLQEYGSIDDDECFQTGGRSVLNAKALDRLQRFVRPPAVQLEVSALRGGEALR